MAKRGIGAARLFRSGRLVGELSVLIKRRHPEVQAEIDQRLPGASGNSVKGGVTRQRKTMDCVGKLTPCSTRHRVSLGDRSSGYLTACTHKSGSVIDVRFTPGQWGHRDRFIPT